MQETWRNNACTRKTWFSRLHLWFILISFQKFFPKIWVAKLQLIGKGSLYASVYGKHHKIHVNLFSTLFKFICNHITKSTTPNDVNFAACDKLCNFPTKFSVKFTTLFWDSRSDWQLRNEIAKFVTNIGNFKRTSETVGQKFCEMHCEWVCKRFH